MRILKEAIAVVALSGCSWSTSAHTRTAPVADTAIGAGAIGASIGGIGLAMYDRGDATLPITVVSIALVATGVAFFASARDGFHEHDAWNAQRVAMQQPDVEPLHVEVTQQAASCEQRRLDMYTRAVTGADPDQRAQLLAILPTCTSETANREKAWMLTRDASVAAGVGKCDDVEPLARQIYDLDVALHDVVMLSDIEIKFCLSRREL